MWEPGVLAGNRDMLFGKYRGILKVSDKLFGNTIVEMAQMALHDLADQGFLFARRGSCP